MDIWLCDRFTSLRQQSQSQTVNNTIVPVQGRVSVSGQVTIMQRTSVPVSSFVDAKCEVLELVMNYERSGLENLTCSKENQDSRAFKKSLLPPILVYPHGHDQYDVYSGLFSLIPDNLKPDR